MFGLKFILNLYYEEISYEQLANILGLKSKGTIGNWLKRGRVPNDDMVQRLAEVLNVDAHYINKNLTKEEMEWLTYKHLQNKFKRRHEKRKIDYYDEDKQILYKNYSVVGQSDESKHEEEELWEREQDSSLKVEVLKFINSFYTADDRHGARCILSQLITLVGNDEDKMQLAINLLYALESILKTYPDLLAINQGKKQAIEEFSTKLLIELNKLVKDADNNWC